MNLLDLARAVLPDGRVGDTPTKATPDQSAELRDLIAAILANDSEADRAEALRVALADPEAALMSFRALVADIRTDTRAPAREAGPYTTAPLAERDPSDDRRTCSDCTNLTAREHRCLAAWRGERPGNAPSNFHPVIDVLGRCECYQPKPSEADQRSGAERWPYLIADTQRLQARNPP